MLAAVCVRRTHIHFATQPHLLRANAWAGVFLLLRLPVRWSLVLSERVVETRWLPDCISACIPF